MATQVDQRASGRRISLMEALNEALREEMAADPMVFVLGEDIGSSGGVFGVTSGLLAEFGPGRIVDTPVSEAGITGLGVGAALVGGRPVVELQLFDLVTIAMDQLVNHAAKWRYMSGGQVSVPLVVRGPSCNGFGLGAQHSQSLESWFINTPGLVVCMPSNAYDAKGLLKAAIRDPNPVVFIERRGLYGKKDYVPTHEYTVPIGQARRHVPGNDVTVVATGQMVPIATALAKSLSRQSVSVEVIDPVTLKPLDIDTIAASVEKTGRLVVANEGAPECGFASEVVARTIEAVGIRAFKATPARVTARDAPVPFAAELERCIMPQREDLRRAISQML